MTLGTPNLDTTSMERTPTHAIAQTTLGSSDGDEYNGPKNQPDFVVNGMDQGTPQQAYNYNTSDMP